MRSDMIVALIGAALSAWIGWMWGRRSGRRSAMTAADLAVAIATPDALYEVEELSCVVEFDDGGDGLYTRTEAGIRPSFDVAELIIPYRFSVTAPGTLGTPEIESAQAIAFTPIINTDTRVTGSIRLTGPFARGATVGSYILRQRFTRAFLMTRKEVLAAYRDSPVAKEYFGVASQVPARLLRCVVRFPESHRDLSETPTAIAFIGETESVNESETARVRPWFRWDRSGAGAELTVERPRSGIRYAIAWLPPDVTAKSR
jgi:hypothetical protein